MLNSYMGKIDDFLHNFITINHPRLNGDEFLRSLIFDYLGDMEVSSISLWKIDNNGRIQLQFGFGTQHNSLKTLMIHDINPVTHSLRHNELQILSDSKKISSAHSNLRPLLAVHPKWQTALVCPISPLGFLFIIVKQNLEVTEEMELFLRIIGRVTFNNYSEKENTTENHQDEQNRMEGPSHVKLTGRQLIILSLIEKGFTNEAIAREIGFSHSLVRQETVLLYRKMGVHSRKELVERAGA